MTKNDKFRLSPNNDASRVSSCDDVRVIPYNDLHSASILYDILHSLLRKSLIYDESPL